MVSSSYSQYFNYLKESLSCLSLANSFSKITQKTENQYLKEINEGLQTLQSTYPSLFPESKTSSLSYHDIEAILNLAHELSIPLDPQFTELRDTWIDYMEHLSLETEYIDPYTCYITARKAAQEAGYSDTTLNMRALCLRTYAENSYLAQHTNPECHAYAAVRKSEEHLQLFVHYLSQETPLEGTLLLQQAQTLASSSIPPKTLQLLEQKIAQYQKALTHHQEVVDHWKLQQGASLHVLYEDAVDKQAGPCDNFLWEGRARALNRLIDRQNQLLQQEISNLYTDYQADLKKATTSLAGRLRKIDPSLVGESSYGNSSWKIVRLFTWLKHVISKKWHGEKSYEPLANQYRVLTTKLNTPIPQTSQDIEQWMDDLNQLEKVSVSSEFTSLKTHYQNQLATITTSHTAAHKTDRNDPPIPTPQVLKILQAYLVLQGQDLTYNFFEKLICDFDRVTTASYTPGQHTHTFTLDFDYPDDYATRNTEVTLQGCKISLLNQTCALKIQYPKRLQFTIDSTDQSISFSPDSKIELLPVKPLATQDIFLEKIHMYSDGISLQLNSKKSTQDSCFGLAKIVKSQLIPTNPITIRESILSSFGDALNAWTYLP